MINDAIVSQWADGEVVGDLDFLKGVLPPSEIERLESNLLDSEGE